MSRAIKLKNNDYLDSTSIVIDKTILKTYLNNLNNGSCKTSYLGQNPNINNLKTTGVYGLYGCSQAPNGGIGVLEVLRYSSDWLIQRFTTIEANPRMWERSFTSGTTWGSWKQRW